MRKTILSALLLLWAGAIPVQAAAPAMRPVAIELPDQVLGFSLPEEIVRGEWPIKFTQRFDPQNASFIENRFYGIFEAFYDINGPFWVGAYGSLEMHFMVQKRSAEIGGDITTIEGLERYLPEWRKASRGRALGYVYSRASLNGMPVIRRDWNTFGDPGDTEPEQIEIFSIPLDAEIFLEVGFTVKGWEGGHGKERKWKPRLEALRDAIKATVVVEPKLAR